MKDLIFVTGSLTRGGAEGVLVTIANELSRRGWKIYIISILFPTNDYSLGNNVEFIDISKKEANQVLDTARMVYELRKIIKNIKPHAVISFMVAINIVTWLATRGLNIKFIPSERNDPSKGRNWLIKILQKWAYGSSSATVFQTQRAQNYFCDKIKNKGVIIPNPINVPFYAPKEKEHLIVNVGRLSAQKNQNMLIESFAAFLKSHPDYLLKIYGEGELRDKLQQKIKELGISENAFLCGKVDNIYDQIKNASMFVLSSDYEGLSNALLEAVAMGIPAITTNCAGAEDAIEHMKTGIIVPVGDVKAMVSALCYMADNPEQAKLMGDKSRERSKVFETNAVVSAWEAIIT